MNKYEDVYDFKVLDEIRNGNKIYVVDKAKAEVVPVTQMSVEHFIKAMDDNSNRYDFYKCVICEENKEGAE